MSASYVLSWVDAGVDGGRVVVFTCVRDVSRCVIIGAVGYFVNFDIDIIGVVDVG